MSVQLALKFPLDDAARLADYVGPPDQWLTETKGVTLVSGPPGSGKSHLLQALCREARRLQGKAVYIPRVGEHGPTILEGLESFPLVCLDGIDAVIGGEAWEIALFHLVNAILHKEGKLVLSSRLAVAELEFRLADLESRLKSAYFFFTPSLDDDGKLEVIRRKARRRGFEMSEDVCRFILGRARRDMHHLARLVETLDGETMRRQKKVTIPFVKEALGL